MVLFKYKVKRHRLSLCSWQSWVWLCQSWIQKLNGWSFSRVSLSSKAWALSFSWLPSLSALGVGQCTATTGWQKPNVYNYKCMPVAFWVPQGSFLELSSQGRRQSVPPGISGQRSRCQSKVNTQQIFLIELTQIIIKHFSKIHDPNNFKNTL